MLPLLLAASLHLGPAGGFGAAYGLAGFHFEVGYGHVSVFGGVGFVDFPNQDEFDRAATAGPVFGGRIYSGDMDGFFLSVSAAHFSTHNVYDPSVPSEFFDAERWVYAADVGYRWVLGRFATADDAGWRAWLELAAGPALSRVHITGTDSNGHHYDLGWERHFGISEHPKLPDLSIAFGVDLF